MTTEAEVLSMLQSSLRQAREACDALKMNAVERRHGNAQYARLSRAFKHAEGACRQMAHWRGDARWLRLGVTYGRMLEPCRRLYLKGKWKAFHEIARTIESHIREVDDLATRKTERAGTLILPKRPSDWLAPGIEPPGAIQ